MNRKEPTCAAAAIKQKNEQERINTMYHIPDNKYAKVNDQAPPTPPPAPGKDGLEALRVYDGGIVEIFFGYPFRNPFVGEFFVSRLSPPGEISIVKCTEFDGMTRKRFIIPTEQIQELDGNYFFVPPSSFSAPDPAEVLGDDEQLERLLAKLGIEQVLFVLGSSFARVSRRRGDTFYTTAQQLLGLRERIGRRYDRDVLAGGGGQ